MSRTRLRESIPDNPYHLLVLDLIRDAVEMVRGEVKAATEADRAAALAFLTDSKCERWCDYVGLEYEAVLRAARNWVGE